MAVEDVVSSHSRSDNFTVSLQSYLIT